MPNYRRYRVPGARYFFTVALADRQAALLIDQIDDLRRAYLTTISEYPIYCDAMVVLPNHLHAVWTLPPGDAAFPERWRRLKARFTRSVGIEVPRTPSKLRKRERGIWQRRYWEHMIRDEADYQLHVAYCWNDPVQHGLVSRASDWPYSSIHRDIKADLVPPDWSAKVPQGAFGE